MQGKISANLAWRALRSVILGICVSGSLAARVAEAAPFHEDGKAGIRFPIPFAHYEEKTGAQVTALVLHDPRVKIPAGIEMTSGVYDVSGDPFFVVWRKDEGSLPTQKQLLDLAGSSSLLRRLMPWAKGLPDDLQFDAATLRGTGNLRTTGELKGRALLQVTREGSVFVGLFYKSAADGDLLSQAGEGLVVLPGRNLRFAELLPGGLPLRDTLGVAMTTLAVTFAAVALTWRRTRGGPKGA